MGRVVCFGEVLLRLSAPGREPLLLSHHIEANFAGAEANAGVALARFGHAARMVGVLPENALGCAALEELRRHGLDTDGIQFAPGRMGLYFFTHGAPYRPAQVLYDRAGSAFAVASADRFQWPALLAGADWLHLTGITPALSDAAAKATLQAARYAREIGVRVSFDCNYRPALWAGKEDKAADLLGGICGQADLIFAQDRDIALILRADPSVSAGAAFRAFPNLQWIAATILQDRADGHQDLSGALHSRKARWTARTFALHSVVGRIGRGDAFAAGLLHGLMTDAPPQRSIDFAVAAACLKHSIPGDFLLADVAGVEALLGEDTMVDVRR